MLNLSHLTFSIDRGKLVTVGYLADAREFAERLEELVEGPGTETETIPTDSI